MASEDKLVNVVVKYSTEGADQAAQSYVMQGKAADDYYAKLAQIQAAHGDTLAQDFQDFQKQYYQTATKATHDTKTLTNALSEQQHVFHSLRQAGFELSQLGTILTLGGGLLTAGITADANNYVKTVGNINSENAKWLQYESELKNANLEIGRSAEQAILPGMKAAADMAQRIADFVKANPWVLEGALTVGGVMLTLGIATKVIAELIRAISDVGLLMTKMGIVGGAKTLQAGTDTLGGGAAGASGIGAALGMVTLTATSVIIGAELGMALGNWLGKLLYGKEYQPQNLQDAYMTLMKLFQLPWVGLASILGRVDKNLTDTMNNFIMWINNIDAQFGKLIGASKYQTPEGPSVDQAAMITEQEVQAFIDRNKQLAAAQENYDQQRADIVTRSEQQIIDVTAAYESQRGDIINNYSKQVSTENRNFNEQQANAARNFNEQQAKMTRDFNIREAEAKHQHQIDIQRMEADHNARIMDLAAQRDALGIEKENESFKTNVQRKNQDFADQQTQDRQQHELQMSDARRAFDQQRADAQAAHQQQLQDQQIALTEQLAKLDAAHIAEMAKIKKGEDDKLNALDSAYQKQVSQIQTAFVDRLRALDANILGDTAAFTKYMADEAAQFQGWLAAFKSGALGYGGASAGAAAGSGSKVTTGTSGGPQITMRQAGGYANIVGPGEDGKDEYILSNPTTRMMESIMGSKLTQSSMLATLMAGRNAQMGQNGRNLNVTVTGRSMSIQEIRTMVDHTLDQRLSDLIPAFGG